MNETNVLRIQNRLSTAAQQTLQYVWAVIPLAASLLLQRLEHVVDNRFIGQIGPEPLLIHSIQYNIFLIGQTIGSVAATSALIFWKRSECLTKQKSLLTSHAMATACIALIAAILIYPFLPWMAKHFGVTPDWLSIATMYLRFGLILMVAQAVYAPINAMLVTTGQETKSMTNVGLILACKFSLNFAVTNLISDPYLALKFIMLGSIVIVVSFMLIALRQVWFRAQGNEVADFREIFPVYSSELGTAAIGMVTPLLFGLLIARI
ncbi:MAG: MATE family efflux transporter, partial [Elusimicrobiota bacterium]